MYYYPNRPMLIPADPDHPMNPTRHYLDELEAEGKWLAEQKWNGDNCLVVKHAGVTEFWNRHKAKLNYHPSDDVLEELSYWPDDMVLNVELVHNRTKTVKDTLIAHCIMRWQGEWLMGNTWGDSRAMLDQAINEGLSGRHVQVSRVWKSGFWDLFNAADGKIIEGIVLKNPAGKLVFSATLPKDVSWMRKVRKPCRKYNF